jgi:hypothetical protein
VLVLQKKNTQPTTPYYYDNQYNCMEKSLLTRATDSTSAPAPGYLSMNE